MIAFHDILRAVRRRLALALLVAALVAGGTAAFTYTATPRYAAETMVRVEQRAAGISDALAALSLSQRLAQTYTRVVTTRTLAERVAQRLDGDVTYGEIMRSLSAYQIENLDLMKIRAESADATRAADISNAAALALSDYVEELAGDNGGERLVIIDSAVPDFEPIFPKKTLNLALGVVVGCLLGVMTALAVEIGLDRVSDAAELERLTGLQVLGMIPMIEERRK